MAYNKGVHSSNSGGSHMRGRPYALIMLITFGIALLGVMVLHKLREKRIYTLLVKEKDQQILALHLLLQKERDRSIELRRKNEEMKGKLYTLRSQKMELARTVVEMQSTLDSLKDEQKLMESAFEEQQNELRLVQERGSIVGQGGASEIKALRDHLKHREEDIKDLKSRFEIPVNDHTTIFTEIVTGNETMAAQDEAKKDDNSQESAKYEGDSNEGAGRSELTKFNKDGAVATEIKDEIGTDEELGKVNEDPQEDGGGAAAKDIDEAMREDHAGQVENGTDFKVKQLAGMKRKHGRASRAKGKRWRTTMKNSLRENNGVFKNHSGNRKVYKDELEGRRVRKVSDGENFARKDVGKFKSLAKLLKTENHESREDGNEMKVNNTKQQVTSSGTNIYTEENKQSLVQQNRSKGDINKADKNAGQTKSEVLLEGLEEVLDVQKQEKDSIDSGHDDEDNDDDFFGESHSEFEDERDDYKEEIDESEFQSELQLN